MEELALRTTPVFIAPVVIDDKLLTGTRRDPNELPKLGIGILISIPFIPNVRLGPCKYDLRPNMVPKLLRSHRK